MQARYTPSWCPDTNGSEKFLGYAGVLDVYYERGMSDGDYVFVVGPNERKLDPAIPHNYDGYPLRDGKLDSPTDSEDMHIELSEMCELYALLAQKGLIEGVSDGLHQ